MKKIKKIEWHKKLFSLWLIIALLGIFIFAKGIKAASSNLSIDYPGKPGPLFTINNMAPTDSEQKVVTVTNNSDTEQMFAFRISQIIGDTPLANVINLKVKRFGQVLLDDTISNLKNPDERDIDLIAAKTTANFDFIITMQNVGNDYQGLRIETADFVVGFSQEGQVLGDKTEGKVAGEKLSTTGNSLGLPILLSFIIASIMLVLGDKKKRQKFIKLFR